MNIPKISILLAALMFCSTPLLAQPRALYSFLRNDAGARGAGLAGAVVALTGDPQIVAYNPATLSTVDSAQISVTFLKHVLDINSGVITYANDLSAFDDDGRFAVSANYVNYGSFDRADRNGQVTGSFGAFDLALSGAYSNLLDSNVSYGVALKFIANSLENESSQAVAVDAGILYSIPESRVNIGLAVLHLGTQLSNLSGVSESLPVDVRLGFNHRLRGLPLLLNVSFHRLADDYEEAADRLQNFAIGGEFYFSKAVHVRVGYDNQRRSDLSPDSEKKLAGFNGGLGILFDTFVLDYAVSSFGQAGEQHRFSLNFGI